MENNANLLLFPWINFLFSLEKLNIKKKKVSKLTVLDFTEGLLECGVTLTLQGE